MRHRSAACQNGAYVCSAVCTRIAHSRFVRLSAGPPGKSFNFIEADVSHNCPEGSKFLGMKTTYYLECSHSQVLSEYDVQSSLDNHPAASFLHFGLEKHAAARIILMRPHLDLIDP